MRLRKILGSAAALALSTIVLLSAACGGAAPTASTPPASSPSKAQSSSPAAQPSSPAAQASSSPSAAQAWQQEYTEWEKKTYEAAKKEGKVVGYGFWSPENEKIRRDYFSKKYPGIELETLTTTTAAEKLRTEKETRNYVADFYIGGGTTPYTLNQFGLTEPFMPPLEKEPGAKWVVGPSASTTYPQLTYAVTGKGIMINTNLVPPNREPKQWKDLLDPF